MHAVAYPTPVDTRTLWPSPFPFPVSHVSATQTGVVPPMSSQYPVSSVVALNFTFLKSGFLQMLWCPSSVAR